MALNPRHRLCTLLLVLCMLMPCSALAAKKTSGPTATPAPTIPEPTLSRDAADYDPEHPENLESNQLYASSAILVEASSGDVIFEKDAYKVMYPASMTKMMTIMLALNAVDQGIISLDDMVTVSARAMDIPDGSSTMGLKEGETLSFQDLLYGTVLCSANEGANVIAEVVSGSIEAFVDLMNETAYELGCTSTHFANPHGYHDDNHYTTAYDLTLIARAAMQNDTFMQISGTYSYTLAKTNMHKMRTITNTNTLLKPDTSDNANKYYYEYATGLKTGTTSKAGYCFAASAEKDGVELISVVMFTGNRARWADSIKLMNYGFSQYVSVTPVDLYNMNPIVIETSGYSLQDTQLGKL